MLRRWIYSFAVALVALLALAAPVLAGGWAVVTLDALPKEVRAGQSMHLGFTIRQHGTKPTNTDWEGRPLKPILTARKQEAGQASLFDQLLGVKDAYAAANQAATTLRVEARQEGPEGHFVVDVVFPSPGTWEWELAAPPFTFQGNTPGDALQFAPLTVLPALAAAAQAAQAAEPAASGAPFVDRVMLRWAGLILLIAAAGIALVRRRVVADRRVAVRQ